MPRGPLVSVIALFLRLGITAFGGPAAALAMMRDEVVARRRWLDDARFLDLLGAANLTPGPTASKMAMYLGYVQAGVPGFLAGGLSYVLPAVLMMLGLGWVYVHYHTTPAAAWLLYGTKAVVIPIILVALNSLGRQALATRLTGAVTVAAVALYLANINPLIILLGSAVCVWLVRVRPGWPRGASVLGFGLAGSVAGTTTSIGLLPLFLVFLKIGAVLYGSGYVLLAFLQADLVTARGWLTEQMLIDAVALGQITPGPLSASATFIGYLLAGVPGAFAATAGIYLPAFVIVGVSGPLLPRLRRVAGLGHLLDGVNAAAVGLMAGVAFRLAQAAFVDVFAVAIAGVAAVLLLRWRCNSALLIIIGAGLGLLRHTF